MSWVVKSDYTTAPNRSSTRFFPMRSLYPVWLPREVLFRGVSESRLRTTRRARFIWMDPFEWNRQSETPFRILEVGDKRKPTIWVGFQSFRKPRTVELTFEVAIPARTTLLQCEMRKRSCLCMASVVKWPCVPSQCVRKRMLDRSRTDCCLAERSRLAGRLGFAGTTRRTSVALAC